MILNGGQWSKTVLQLVLSKISLKMLYIGLKQINNGAISAVVSIKFSNFVF